MRHCVINNIRRVETLDEFNVLQALGSSFFTLVPVCPINPELINNYIIGFINAEATFTTVYHGQPEKRRAKFALEHTDYDVLEMIRKHLDFSTSVYSPTQRQGRKPTYAISVTNSPDLARLVNLINHSYPLQGYKLHQYNN